MPPHPQLWSVSLVTSPQLAESFASALAPQAAALTIFAPPRQPKARIEALFEVAPERGALTAALSVAALLAGTPCPVFHITKVPDLDWLEKVAGDFPPLKVARWIIYGARHRNAVLDLRHALQIDATSAFGTGEHLTTRGCLLMLESVLKSRRGIKRVLDVGCGSGVLAMAYAKAERGRAIAVELDPQAVEIARENVQKNGLRQHVRITQGHGYRPSLVKRFAPYDLIMANIFARPLASMAPQLRQHLKPGGLAILAGLLASQANAVIAAHRLQGLYLVRKYRLGEWVILAFKRSGKA